MSNIEIGHEILFNVGIELRWDDPDPIEGNDYTITHLECKTREFNPKEDRTSDLIYLIHYGKGSEAEVYHNEIKVV